MQRVVKRVIHRSLCVIMCGGCDIKIALHSSSFVVVLYGGGTSVLSVWGMWCGLDFNFEDCKEVDFCGNLIVRPCKVLKVKFKI